MYTICCRYKLLKSSGDRMAIDGLSNVDYTLRGYCELPLYTNITIHMNIQTANEYLRTIGYEE